MESKSHTESGGCTRNEVTMVTTTSENKEHVRRVETAVNDQDHDVLSEIFIDDLTIHFHGGREELTGLDAFRAYLTELYDAFPDITVNFQEMIEEDDMVAVRYTGTGTHKGEYGGIAPTGERIQLSGMRFCRLKEGKIAEVWGQRDDLGQLVQLGVVEPPEG